MLPFHLPALGTCYVLDKQFGCLPTHKALFISLCGNPFLSGQDCLLQYKVDFVLFCPNSNCSPPLLFRGPILTRKLSKPFLTCHTRLLPHPSWINISRLPASVPLILVLSIPRISSSSLPFPSRHLKESGASV